MLKVESNIKNTRHILLMWFVLFSLSPCIVKEALFHSVNAEYSKPLHKSKTTTSSSLCQYSASEGQHISDKKHLKNKKQIQPVNSADNQYVIVRSDQAQNNYSKTFSGNSPPKYILYKRLKIDVA